METNEVKRRECRCGAAWAVRDGEAQPKCPFCGEDVRVNELTAELSALKAENERLDEVVRNDREKWSFGALLFMAERLLEANYPADVFDRMLKDPGPQLCKALREAVANCKAALTPS